MSKDTFGSTLQFLREQKGYSQYQLGELVGVTNKAVSKWETGYARPRTDLLVRLSEVLEVPMETLLNGTVLMHTMKYSPILT